MMYVINENQKEPAYLQLYMKIREDIVKEKSKTLTDGLMIEAQGNSEHGAVVKLMDSARNAGVKSISLTEI